MYRRSTVGVMLCVGVALALLVAGCGGGGGQPGGTPPTESEIQAALDGPGAAIAGEYQRRLASATPTELATAMAAWAAEQPGVAEAGTTTGGGGVWVRYTCGLTHLFSPPTREADTASAGRVDTADALVRPASLVGSLDAALFAPFFGCPELSAIAEKVYGTDQGEVTYDQSVTVEDFAHIPAKGIIYFDTHGDAWEQSGRRYMCLYTNQAYSPSLHTQYASEYGWDALTCPWVPSTIVGPGEQPTHFSVTQHFFDKTLPDLPASLVFPNACCSLRWDDMADVFRRHGAQAYVGWTWYVSDFAARGARKRLLGQMLGYDSLTNDPITVRRLADAYAHPPFTDWLDPLPLWGAPAQLQYRKLGPDTSGGADDTTLLPPLAWIRSYGDSNRVVVDGREVRDYGELDVDAVAFSDDGKRLVVATTTDAETCFGRLAVINADTGVDERVVAEGVGLEFSNMAYRAGRIAWTCHDVEGGSDRAFVDGREVLNDGWNLEALALSADGKHLAVAEADDSRSRVVVLNADTGAQEAVPDSSGTAFLPEVAYGGGQLAWLREVAGLGEASECTIVIDGREVYHYDVAFGYVHLLALSRDGKHLVVGENLNDFSQLVVRNATTGALERVLDGSATAPYRPWSASYGQ